MAETQKAKERREQAGYFTKYLKGRGIDIGAGDDPVTPDCDTFEKVKPDNGVPQTKGNRFWGDAHTMEGVKGGYDFVYSSHLLEHLEHPVEALAKWYSLLKPGGYLIVAVPHRDTYERKRNLPSRWNEDHKTFWTLETNEPPVTWGILPLMKELPGAVVCEACECTEGADPTLPIDTHQTGEYQIEVIVRKPKDVDSKK